ncbi:MAG: Polypeptide-transport-associated domain protein ShlB-type [Alphaproteobacteria bacterium]|nr:Polypeptide-transport-associated domain protein ShlB-type [Alphaproteobacteria bacterium]
MLRFSSRVFASLPLFVFVLVFSIPAALAQSPRIINENRLDYGGASTIDRRTRIPRPRDVETPQNRVDDNSPRVVLQKLELSGSTLSQRTVNEFWSHWQGKRISQAGMGRVADDLKKTYSENDYALYGVTIPPQDFARGILRLEVTEGYIGAVGFEGDMMGDLSLARAFAEKLKTERPLRRSTFQRYMLLMGDIPGLRIQPRFLPMNKDKGVVKLQIALTKRPVELGLTYNNQGAETLARSQFDSRLSFNSVLRQGDYTEFGYGFPDDFERYSLLSFFHEQPVNSEGTRASVFYSRLHTNPNDFQEGQSYSAGAQITHPLLRSKTDNIIANIAVDGLNNDNAILGQTIADERTRVLRAGFSGDHTDKKGNFTGGFLNISRGFNILGARQSVFFGDPNFTKGNIRIDHDHALPLRFIGRIRSAAQVTAETLPSSEQLTFGGNDFGGGFEISRFAADRGVVGAGELAYPLDRFIKTRFINFPEIYGFADYGYLTNLDKAALGPPQEASSAGIGTRFGVTDKLAVQLQAGKAISTPSFFSDDEKGWRYFMQIRTVF